MKGKLLIDFSSNGIKIPAGTEVNVRTANVEILGIECTEFIYENKICLIRSKDILIENSEGDKVREVVRARLEKKKDDEIKIGAYNDTSAEIKKAAAKEWFI